MAVVPRGNIIKPVKLKSCSVVLSRCDPVLRILRKMAQKSKREQIRANKQSEPHTSREPPRNEIQSMRNTHDTFTPQSKPGMSSANQASKSKITIYDKILMGQSKDEERKTLGNRIKLRVNSNAIVTQTSRLMENTQVDLTRDDMDNNTLATQIKLMRAKNSHAVLSPPRPKAVENLTAQVDLTNDDSDENIDGRDTLGDTLVAQIKAIEKSNFLAIQSKAKVNGNTRVHKPTSKVVSSTDVGQIKPMIAYWDSTSVESRAKIVRDITREKPRTEEDKDPFVVKTKTVTKDTTVNQSKARENESRKVDLPRATAKDNALVAQIKARMQSTPKSPLSPTRTSENTKVDKAMNGYVANDVLFIKSNAGLNRKTIVVNENTIAQLRKYRAENSTPVAHTKSRVENNPQSRTNENTVRDNQKVKEGFNAFLAKTKAAIATQSKARQNENTKVNLIEDRAGDNRYLPHVQATVHSRTMPGQSQARTKATAALDKSINEAEINSAISKAIAEKAEKITHLPQAKASLDSNTAPTQSTARAKGAKKLDKSMNEAEINSAISKAIADIDMLVAQTNPKVLSSAPVTQSKERVAESPATRNDNSVTEQAKARAVVDAVVAKPKPKMNIYQFMDFMGEDKTEDKPKAKVDDKAKTKMEDGKKKDPSNTMKDKDDIVTQVKNTIDNTTSNGQSKEKQETTSAGPTRVWVVENGELISKPISAFEVKKDTNTKVSKSKAEENRSVNANVNNNTLVQAKGKMNTNVKLHQTKAEVNNNALLTEKAKMAGNTPTTQSGPRADKNTKTDTPEAKSEMNEFMAKTKGNMNVNSMLSQIMDKIRNIKTRVDQPKVKADNNVDVSQTKPKMSKNPIVDISKDEEDIVFIGKTAADTNSKNIKTPERPRNNNEKVVMADKELNKDKVENTTRIESKPTVWVVRNGALVAQSQPLVENKTLATPPREKLGTNALKSQPCVTQKESALSKEKYDTPKPRVLPISPQTKVVHSDKNQIIVATKTNRPTKFKRILAEIKKKSNSTSIIEKPEPDEEQVSEKETKVEDDNSENLGTVVLESRRASLRNIGKKPKSYSEDSDSETKKKESERAKKRKIWDMLSLDENSEPRDAKRMRMDENVTTSTEDHKADNHITDVGWSGAWSPRRPSQRNACKKPPNFYCEDSDSKQKAAKEGINSTENKRKISDISGSEENTSEYPLKQAKPDTPDTMPLGENTKIVNGTDELDPSYKLKLDNRELKIILTRCTVPNRGCVLIPNEDWLIEWPRKIEEPKDSVSDEEEAEEEESELDKSIKAISIDDLFKKIDTSSSEEIDTSSLTDDDISVLTDIEETEYERVRDDLHVLTPLKLLDFSYEDDGPDSASNPPQLSPIPGSPYNHHTFEYPCTPPMPSLTSIEEDDHMTETRSLVPRAFVESLLKPGRGKRKPPPDVVTILKFWLQAWKKKGQIPPFLEKYQAQIPAPPPLYHTHQGMSQITEDTDGHGQEKNSSQNDGEKSQGMNKENNTVNQWHISGCLDDENQWRTDECNSVLPGQDSYYIPEWYYHVTEDNTEKCMSDGENQTFNGKDSCHDVTTNRLANSESLLESRGSYNQSENSSLGENDLGPQFWLLEPTIDRPKQFWDYGGLL